MLATSLPVIYEKRALFYLPNAGFHHILINMIDMHGNEGFNVVIQFHRTKARDLNYHLRTHFLALPRWGRIIPAKTPI